MPEKRTHIKKKKKTLGGDWSNLPSITTGIRRLQGPTPHRQSRHHVANQDVLWHLAVTLMPKCHPLPIKSL